jgi:crossover junction endodeoxyribonuclease RuvC
MEALYFAKNVTSALSVSEAKGVLRLTCRQAGLSVVEYGPGAIKQSLVGRGRAEKPQVQEFVRMFLGLPDIPRPDHAADALAAAVCHAHNRWFDPRIPGTGPG